MLIKYFNSLAINKHGNNKKCADIIVVSHVGWWFIDLFVCFSNGNLKIAGVFLNRQTQFKHSEYLIYYDWRFQFVSYSWTIFTVCRLFTKSWCVFVSFMERQLNKGAKGCATTRELGLVGVRPSFFSREIKYQIFNHCFSIIWKRWKREKIRRHTKLRRAVCSYSLAMNNQ